MSEDDCAGRHVCEPPMPPDSIADRWTCPECDSAWSARRAGDMPLPAPIAASIPAETIGWHRPGAVG